ncbi:hypothetical protein B0H14DRAFT_2633588 [Mycena olivaceomarginata]|nr:hypothetical protein B0H14DRAFT_2633588 [Mycena olivaceomarginata]
MAPIVILTMHTSISGVTAIFALADQYGTTTDIINGLTTRVGRGHCGRPNPEVGSAPNSVLVPGFGNAASDVGNAGAQPQNICGPLNFLSDEMLVGFFWAQKVGLFGDSKNSQQSVSQLNILTCGYILSSCRLSWLGSWLRALRAMGLRMYDRGLKPVPEPSTTDLRYRVETLIGLTGHKMAKHRDSRYNAIMSPICLAWRPQLLGLLFFEGMMFGFGIGINVRKGRVGDAPLRMSAIQITTLYFLVSNNQA